MKKTIFKILHSRIVRVLFFTAVVSISAVTLCLFNKTDKNNFCSAAIANQTKAVEQLLDDAVVLGSPFQPTADEVKAISRLVKASDSDTNRRPGTDVHILIVNGLPYHPYVYLADDTYAMHPMALGRFLLENATASDVSEIVNSVINVAVELPNGGLAWYYPKLYPLARMQGPDMRYSGISQGTLLSGFLRVGLVNPRIGLSPAQKVVRGMMFPFFKGGVSLEGKAILEMPSYRSAPEIILNGWLDALLHLNGYVRKTGDKAAHKFLDDNVRFLAEILPVFDEPKTRLSRYSDLSPYKILINVPDKIPAFKVLYVPKFPGLKSIIVPLEKIENPAKPSIYDNQILRIDGRDVRASIACSQLYDTYLISDSANFKVNIASGILDFRKTTPGDGGKKFILESEPFSKGSFVSFDQISEDLICGYPTNFLKNKNYNYYHVYHVVALMVLADAGEFSDSDEAIMLRWSEKWRGYMDANLPDGIEFNNPQDTLISLNKNLFEAEWQDYELLVEHSNRRLAELKKIGF